ncbi:MAG: FKBP-type peptidyl-prolyl cis-trans isomerase [Desulfobacterales bacterium]
MKVKVVAIAAVCVGLAGCQPQANSEQKASIELKDQQDKVTYSIGYNIGNNLKQQKVEVKADVLAKGINDALAGNDQMMTQEEMQETMKQFQNEQMAKMQKEREEASGKNKAEGETFLAENKSKEGVVTLESGLQYKVVEAGKGNIPAADDTVVVHYKGTLLDGTEFDSSYKRGQPATFPVKGVIPAWTEALQLMKEGAKWQLFIPSNLAYGERGAGGIIGPNATLLFDVELIEIKKPENNG